MLAKTLVRITKEILVRILARITMGILVRIAVTNYDWNLGKNLRKNYYGNLYKNLGKNYYANVGKNLGKNCYGILVRISFTAISSEYFFVIITMNLIRQGHRSTGYYANLRKGLCRNYDEKSWKKYY